MTERIPSESNLPLPKSEKSKSFTAQLQEARDLLASARFETASSLLKKGESVSPALSKGTNLEQSPSEYTCYFEFGLRDRWDDFPWNPVDKIESTREELKRIFSGWEVSNLRIFDPGIGGSYWKGPITFEFRYQSTDKDPERMLSDLWFTVAFSYYPQTSSFSNVVAHFMGRTLHEDHEFYQQCALIIASERAGFMDYLPNPFTDLQITEIPWIQDPRFFDSIIRKLIDTHCQDMHQVWAESILEGSVLKALEKHKGVDIDLIHKIINHMVVQEILDRLGYGIV